MATCSFPRRHWLRGGALLALALAGRLTAQTDVTITGAGTDLNPLGSFVGGVFSGGILNTSSIYIGTGSGDIFDTLLKELSANGVTITTASSGAGTGNLIVSDTIDFNSTHALELDAGNNLTINRAITNAGTGGLTFSSGGTISLAANVSSGGMVTLSNSGSLTQTAGTVTAGVELYLSGGGDVGAVDSALATSTPLLVFSKSTGNIYVSNDGALALGGASFAGGTLSVTASGAITEGGGFTVTGATILAAGAANDITLSSALNDFSTVAITSGDNVTLADANAIILGASTVSGNLGVTAGGAITQSGALSITGNTTLSASGQAITLTNLGNSFPSATITAGKNVALFDTTGLALGASTITGTLNVTSSGDITETGALSVTGTPTFIVADGGSILLGTQANTFSANPIFATLGGSIANVGFRNSGDVQLPGLSLTGWAAVTSDTGAISQSGAWVVPGTTTLSAATTINLTNPANDFGTVAIASGTDVTIVDANAVGLGTSTVSGDLNVTAGGAITNSGAVKVSGTATFAAGAANDITLNNACNDFSTVVITSGNDVTLRSVDAFDLDTSTISGTLTLAGGTSATLVGDVTAALVQLNCGTLNIGDGGTLSANIDTGTAGTVVFNHCDDLTFGYDISGSGYVVKDGGDNLTLTGTNTFGGLMTINCGTVTIGADSATSSAMAVAVESDGTLALAGTTTCGATIGALSGSGLVTLACNRTLTISGCDDLGEFDGTISGGGALKIAGGGTLTLAGDNTYSGGTFIDDGELVAINCFGSATGTGAITVACDSILQIGNGGTMGSVSGDITDDGKVVFDRSDDSSYSGTISGEGRVTKTGDGTLTLSSANTFSGGTKLEGGTLVATNWCGSATGSGDITIKGLATLQVGDGGSSGSVDGDISFVCDGGSVVFERCDSLTYGGVISGNGEVDINGTGEIVLTGANTYTGGTYINAGTLTVGACDTLPTDGTVTVADGATFNVANNQTIAELDGDCGSSTFLAACQKLTISGCDDLGEFDGTISGEGKLSLTGGGTLTLTGNNTYSGGTKIDGSELLALNYCGSATGSGAITIQDDGTLQIGNGGRKGSVDGDISFICDGGSVVFERCDSLTYGGVISGNGEVDINGTGEIVLTGANTYTGGTYINAGTLTVGACDTLPTDGTVTVADGATFNVANDQTIAKICADSGSTTMLGYCDTLTVSGCNRLGQVDGTISGGGALKVTGGGYLTLTGSNTYCGGTTVEGATLIAANNCGSATGSGTVTVNSGGILGGRGSIDGSLALNCGATVAPGIEKTLVSTCANAPGTLAVGGDATFAGNANFAFHIDDANGCAGYAMDLLTISGGLTLNATEENPFVINLYSLNTCDLPGQLANFDPSQSYSWQFLNADSGISGFDAAAFTVSTASFQNSFTGSFGVAQSGNELLLQYTPAAVPEPATWMLLLAGGAMLGAGGWRRWRRAG